MRTRLALLLILGLSCAGKTPPTAEGPPATTASAGPAATPSPTAAPATDDPARRPMPIDPAIRAGKLENGLTYFLRRHGKPEKRASLRLAVNVGSVLEDESERGFAHFVEHMAFNGTRMFRKQEIVDFMERVGMRFGHDANASTSFDETIYTFEVPTDDPAILDKGLAMLQQIAAEVSFDAEEVDSERGVVIEEWRTGRGAETRVMEAILPTIFKGSRYAERIPIGKKELLAKATPADLRRFYQRWYRPDLMAVAAVGDFDVDTVEKAIQVLFGAIPKPVTPAERPRYPVPDHAETLVALAQDKELPGSSVGVVHKLPHRPEGSERDYRRHIVETAYHQMMNARLMELAQQQNAPFLAAASSLQPFVRPIDAFSQLAQAEGGGIARALEALTREVERVDQKGFTKGELERTKSDLLRFMESAVKEKEKTPSPAFADEMVRHFLTGEAMPGIEAELALFRKYLPTITLDEMNGLAAGWISEKNRVILVLAPSSVKVPAKEELLALFHKVEREQVAAYVDKVSEGPLVADKPKGAKVKSERTIAELGVTEWKLANGATVVVKPTDFKNDQILVQLFGAGGHSRVKDADFVAAQFADGIVDGSGAGRFGPVELRKALAGKLAGASPFIGELEQGLSGRASPADLETFFQLAYLTLTAPRRDEAVFGAFQARLREELANRQLSPEAVFGDRVTTVLYDNHPRRRPLVPGDEKKVTLDRVLAIYGDMFADAAESTVVIVGNVELATLKPLVETYVGGLPNRAGKARFRDVGVRPTKATKSVEVQKGIEPRSVVTLAYTGTARWSHAEQHLFESMVQAIEIKLREVLREELGATYGVDVSGHFERRPVEGYRIDVAWTCAPENVDRMIARVKTEVAAAAQQGFEPPYLEKVKAAQRRAIEQAETTNGYWLDRLVNHYRYGTDPKLILETKKLIEGLDAERLKKAVGRYFDGRRLVTGVLRPEATAAGR